MCPMYVLLLSPSTKFQSISLYEEPFSSERPFKTTALLTPVVSEWHQLSLNDTSCLWMTPVVSEWHQLSLNDTSVHFTLPICIRDIWNDLFATRTFSNGKYFVNLKKNKSTILQRGRFETTKCTFSAYFAPENILSRLENLRSRTCRCFCMLTFDYSHEQPNYTCHHIEAIALVVTVSSLSPLTVRW